jgi:hypothetical protein
MTVPLRLTPTRRTQPGQAYDRTTLLMVAAASWALLLLLGVVLTFG